MPKISSLDDIMEALKRDFDLIQTASYPEVHQSPRERNIEFHYTPGNLKVHLTGAIAVTLTEGINAIHSLYFQPAEIARSLPTIPATQSHLRKLAIHALRTPCNILEACLPPADAYQTLYQFLETYAATDSSIENTGNNATAGFL